MIKLKTVFCSNIPIDCHIIKGRLESEGIPCFIFDEHMIWVHPFRAVAIGGVKLKVPSDRYIQSQKIIDLITQGSLSDENGEYQISEIFDNEIKRQNEILSIKNKIRKDPSLLDSQLIVDNKFIDLNEIDEILKNEREFLITSKKKFKFFWKEFLYELFDFERSVFKYFRTKSVDFYLEKEMVDNYINQQESKPSANCPNCNSKNTAFGYAIDYRWDIPYLAISLLLSSPLFLIRKKHHCFNCGHNFRVK